MTMTEEEAKKKWCPYARHEGDNGGSWNRTVGLMKRVFGWDGGNPYPDETCNCIASECMAWRWKDKSGGYKNYDDARGRAEYAAHQRGFCGLAGAP